MLNNSVHIRDKKSPNLMIGAINVIFEILGTLHQRNKKACIGFFHPGKFVFGKPFYGFIPLLVT